MAQQQNQPSNWPQDVTGNAMTGVGDVDFTKFLDLDTNFEQFQQTDQDDGHTALDTPMGRLAFGGQHMSDLSDHESTMLQNMNMSMMNAGHLHNAYAGMRQNPQDQAQQYQQFQLFQQMNSHQQYRVPPTPVSGEMQAAKYQAQMDNVGQMMFDRGQASFTPLVSPAQTPLDNAFCMPEYVTADDFFSPLTSPAIEAQPQFPSTNATSSPVDLNSDSPNASSNTAQAVKRQRRKPGTTPARNAVRSVRQSPAMKPQMKRRQFSMNSLPVSKIQTMVGMTGPDFQQSLSAHPGVVASSEESVSPEPLSELLMRPPPVPVGSSKSSPYALNPKSKDDGMPATPAMIMRIPGKQTGSREPELSVAANADVMEDIILPDAAAPGQGRRLPNSHSTVTSADEQSTPTLAAKTPKLSADSTPRSATMRAQTAPGESIDKIKRPDTRTGSRASKKRPSVPSAAISPALRPKISPSISPLVPATSAGISHISPETSALYLASKSNYQNILDGTHLPGVSYPDTLAENLSSKRTSHKIAEQGRRNRINLALKEIESLLPVAITGTNGKAKQAGSSKESEAGSPDKNSSAGQGASKASTVEMAIVYIKSLQAELQDTKQKLKAAEKTIAEGVNSGGSETSEEKS